MAHSAHEMEPLRAENGGRKAKHTYWDTVFQVLAEADGERSAPPGDAVDGRRSGSGKPSIHIKKLKNFLNTESSFKLEKETSLPRYRLLHLVNNLDKADLDSDGRIDEAEWERHVRQYGSEFMNTSVMGKALRVIAYSPSYSCHPPTLFLLLITLLQIVFYIMSIVEPSSLGIDVEFGAPSWPISSFFIYDPYKRIEVWRFITYMFLHGHHQHIIFNCLMQLVIGIPLEMSQTGWKGSFRVAGLYMAGVGMGCLGASVAQPDMYLLGASAGVYALIFAHLATLILNWNEDGMVYDARLAKYAQDKEEAPPSPSLNRFIRGLRLGFIIIFTLVDIGTILYRELYLQENSATSYAGHAFGGLAGLLVGTIILENRKVDDWETIYKWIMFGLYWALMLAFVLWEIIGSYTGYFPERK